MATQAIVLEGTWEEVLTHSSELAGQRVRLVTVTMDEPYAGIPADQRPSTAESLLRYAGTWEGDDLQERLQDVYDTRLPSEF